MHFIASRYYYGDSSIIEDLINFDIGASTETTTIESIILYYVDQELVGSASGITTINIKTFTSTSNPDFYWEADSTDYIVESGNKDMNDFLDIVFFDFDRMIYDACGIRMTDLGFTSYTP